VGTSGIQNSDMMSDPFLVVGIFFRAAIAFEPPNTDIGNTLPSLHTSLFAEAILALAALLQTLFERRFGSSAQTSKLHIFPNLSLPKAKCGRSTASRLCRALSM
jgi:hypothetical protein